MEEKLIESILIPIILGISVVSVMFIVAFTIKKNIVKEL